jgi:hypothetical protein
MFVVFSLPLSLRRVKSIIRQSTFIIVYSTAMHTIYSLDDTIKSFFETQPAVTRQQCDDLAVSLVGGPVNPTPIQGAFSYTVIAGVQQTKIVQFRAQSSVLDMKSLSLARAIHGEIVATCVYHGEVGQPSPLSVYEMDRLPGITYIEARCRNGHSIEPSPETAFQHSSTVVDFARCVKPYATSGRADALIGSSQRLGSTGR